jgi:catechol 2,3-dioxygenase-like lactoylglutathione lyase family enzyme
MNQVEIGGASPCFIVRDVPATLAFYREKLGFEITYQGPEPGDIFFGIVQRGRAMIMFKAVGIEPVPNHTRDIGKGNMRWDAYIYVPDPDALAGAFASGNVAFFTPLGNNTDNLRGFEIKDPDGYLLFFGRPNSR